MYTRILDLILETVDHFCHHPRGLNKHGNCSYADGCAVGRLFLYPKYSVDDWDVERAIKACGFKPRYAWLVNHLELLESLQDLHDTKENWVSRRGEGLTVFGCHRLADIINHYCIEGEK